jgi:hypothetical protein
MVSLMVAALMVVFLSACVPDEVETTVSPTAIVPTVSADDLVLTAEIFHDCLSEAELPVALVNNHDGHPAVVQFTGDHWLMVRSPEGGTLRWSETHGSEDDPVAWAAAQEFFSHGNSPGLMLDGVDYTVAYTICLERSGYDSHAAWGTLSMDSFLVLKQVEANNLWADCARNHGWPMVEDSEAVEDPDVKDWPMVSLPVTITEKELRSLLGSCPNFDPQSQEALNQWWHTDSSGGYPDDYLPDPSVDFFIPSLKGSTKQNAVPTPEEQEALDNITNLYTILNEKSAQYWQTRIDIGS